MGPGDPFGNATGTPRLDAGIPDLKMAYDETNSNPTPEGKRRINPLFVGGVLGTLIGVTVLTGLVLEAILLVFFGAIGVGIAWVVQRAVGGQLNFADAWRTLRGKN